MTAYGLAFSPLVPLWLLAALAALALIAAAALLYAGRRGAVLRALSLAVLLGALGGPSLIEEQRENLRDVVAVVLDRSASQSFGDRMAQLEAARTALDKSLASLDVDVRWIDAGAASDEGTRLFSALSAGLADIPSERLAGVIMVTDGVVHDIPASAAAGGFKAPLHVLVTGHEGERDRRVTLVEAPRYGIIGKETLFSVKVEESNGPNDPAPLTVRRDGVVVTRVLAPPGAVLKIPVKLEHGGANVLEFDVEPMPDELTLVNNKAVASVEGVRDHLKVLLVSGEPNPGERSWRNLLKADANVELVHFTILRPPEKQDGTPVRELALIAFPTAELFGKKIGDFDLILFDRYSNMGLLPPIYFDNIVNYVRNGGALAIVAGPSFSEPDGIYYTPLGKVVPARPNGDVSETPFRAVLSDIGRRHPVTRDLPGADSNPPNWSRWFRQEQATTMRGASVLSGVGGAPLLVLSREKKGRVALLLTDQIWLWARGFEGGGPYLDLTRRMAHWLMKEPELEEEALRGKAHGQEINVERQTLGESAGPVHVTSPSGKQQELVLPPAAPGLFRATLKADELGLYRFAQGDLTALVPVGPENPLEYREVVSTPDKLRALAESTGGTVRRLDAERRSDGAGRSNGPGTAAIHMPRIVAMRDSPVYGGADYIGLRIADASVARGVKLTPLAMGFVGLLVLLGFLVGGWLWEGRRGRKV